MRLVLPLSYKINPYIHPSRFRVTVLMFRMADYIYKKVMAIELKNMNMMWFGNVFE